MEIKNNSHNNNQNFSNNPIPQKGIKNLTLGFSASKNEDIQLGEHKFLLCKPPFSTLEDWNNVGEKKFGVEPGFIGQKKIFNDKHLEKALNPDHKYHKKAVSWLENSGIIKNDASVQDIKNAILQQQHNIEFCAAVRSLHIFKLDYAEPKANSDLVGTDWKKAEAPGITAYIPIVNYAARMTHHNTTFSSIRDKNRGAVMEALSNDIYRALGLRSQDLRLVYSEYKDGRPKLMLRTKWVEGKNGEKFQTLQDTKLIQNGHLVDNKLIDPETKKMVPVRAEDLAKLKILMVLMGDHDKIGVSGGNVGYVVELNEHNEKEARIVNIDPGKSLEPAPKISEKGYFGQTDKMTFKNLEDDFSHKNAAATLADKYKPFHNITLCDDISYAEKIKAVRTLEKWDEINLIFDGYLEKFGDNAPNPNSKDDAFNLNFKNEILEARERLNVKRNQILETFKNRLPLSDDQLIVVDGLEKLTSETQSHWVDQKGTKHAFNFLQIAEGKRNRWNMSENNVDNKEFIFEAKNVEEAEKVQDLVGAFLEICNAYNKPSVYLDNKTVIITNISEKYLKILAKNLTELNKIKPAVEERLKNAEN